MADTINDTRTPGEILADAVKLAEETGHSYITVTNQCAERIIELLKEQKAVKPILKREGRNKHYNDYVCPRCDNEVVYEQNYCMECGVRFLWEGQ